MCIPLARTWLTILSVHKECCNILSRKIGIPLVRKNERVDVMDATSTVFLCMACPLPSLCLNKAMVFPPPVGPPVLTPTLLFSGKEPAAHFLNLLGLPVTGTPSPARVAQVKGGGRVELLIRTRNTSLCCPSEGKCRVSPLPCSAGTRTGDSSAQARPSPCLQELTFWWGETASHRPKPKEVFQAPLSTKKINRKGSR